MNPDADFTDAATSAIASLFPEDLDPLMASRLAEFSRFTDEIADALAERTGADPVDPEVQLVALVIAGIVRVRQQSTFHHGRLATSTAAIDQAVHDDLLRAGRIAEPTLTAFDRHRGGRPATEARHQE